MIHPPPFSPPRRRGNGALGAVLAAVVLGMVGMSFAAVPLYRLFCAATGFGGTPKTGLAASPGASTHIVTVRFNANTDPGLPWLFRPEQAEIRLPLGAEQVAFYTARDLAAVPVSGVALYNVTPEKAAKYFHKTACFCFTEQVLAPGQDMQFPLSFWVDPELAEDAGTADVKTITLSYTFYRSLDEAARSGALAAAGPHVGPLVR
jgi:cytochrome c oxidase assembly protein subunit 11